MGIKLLCFILLVYGISNILVFSDGPWRIFEKYRQYMSKLPSNLGEGATCMICTPTVVGAILGLIDVFLVPSEAFTPFCCIIDHWYYFWLTVPLNGALGSGSTWLLHTLQEKLESQIIES